MGEAKRNQEKLKSLLLKQIDRWDFAETEAEKLAVAEIQNLPTIVVRRYPPAALRYMRMKPNECHSNTRFMEHEDPEGRCKQISGYILENGNYVLHSIVERDGETFCVTPMINGAPEEFSFIPDPDLEWREEGDFRIAYRKGVKVEPGFRSNPKENSRIASIVRERIKKGVHPIKAGEPPF